MRLKIRSLRRVVKGNLALEFATQQLTSYSGLELLRRYQKALVDVEAYLRTRPTRTHEVLPLTAKAA